jgi:hypothetical protein
MSGNIPPEKKRRNKAAVADGIQTHEERKKERKRERQEETDMWMRMMMMMW